MVINILESLKKEKEIIERNNAKIIDTYNLVNNYGYKILFNNNEYDLRHYLNIYGQEVNYWEVSGKCKASEEDKKILIDLEKELTKEMK